MKFRAWCCAAFAILVWGVTFANTRALLSDFSSLEIQLIRFSMAWGVLRLAEAFGFAGGRPAAGGVVRDELLFAGLGLFGVALYQFLENCAIYYTNASNVAIFTSFGPIATALLAWAVLGDKSLSPRLAAGSLVAIAGVALVSLGDGPGFSLKPLGDAMALGAMCCWGVYSILIDKVNGRGYPQIVVIRKAFFWSLVFTAPLAAWGMTDSGSGVLDGAIRVTFAADANAARFSNPLNLLNLGVLGVLSSAISFVLWNCACETLGVVRTTIGIYLIPVAGIAFAAAFLGERPPAASVVGGVVIVAGVALANSRWRGRA